MLRKFNRFYHNTHFFRLSYICFSVFFAQIDRAQTDVAKNNTCFRQKGFTRLIIIQRCPCVG